MFHRAVDVGFVELRSDACGAACRAARRLRNDSSGISRPASSQAAPKPTIPGTFACRSACRARARRRPSARSPAPGGSSAARIALPIPLGPYSVWPVIDIRSMLSWITFTGTCRWPAPHRVKPGLPARDRFGRLRYGLDYTISLLPYMTDTRMVLSVIDSRSCPDRSARTEAQADRSRGSRAFQVLAGVEHSLVLRGNGDDMVTLFGLHLRHTLDGSCRIRWHLS